MEEVQSVITKKDNSLVLMLILMTHHMLDSIYSEECQGKSLHQHKLNEETEKMITN